MPPRWTDDRLDDMSQLVHDNDRRLDHAEEQIAQLAHDHNTHRRRQRNRADHQWAIYLLLVTILLTQAAHLLLNTL